jgi:hypothetical protein
MLLRRGEGRRGRRHRCGECQKTQSGSHGFWLSEKQNKPVEAGFSNGFQFIYPVNVRCKASQLAMDKSRVMWTESDGIAA